MQDPSGQPLLSDPEDFVRLKVEAGLSRDLRVIPVLVDRATMPKATELPESPSRLARRSAVEVRHATFGRDAAAPGRSGEEVLEA